MIIYTIRDIGAIILLGLIPICAVGYIAYIKYCDWKEKKKHN